MVLSCDRIIWLFYEPKDLNIMSGSHFIDPEWSPSALVTRRLRDASIAHASRLAERTTIESLLPPTHEFDVVDAVHPLANMALRRSLCPQPPLDDGVTGGGSSVSCDVHFSGMNVRLDPLERCAPHRIIVPSQGSFVRGEFPIAATGLLCPLTQHGISSVDCLARLHRHC